MGCDIHCYGEKKIEGDYTREYVGQFFTDIRSYGLFGWLADVRNYSGIVPLKGVYEGLPVGACDRIKREYKSWEYAAHNLHYVKVDTLLKVDYEQIIEDRRVTRNGNGGCTCEPGEGRFLTLREFLFEGYFEELDRMQQLDVERIIFWFDN